MKKEITNVLSAYCQITDLSVTYFTPDCAIAEELAADQKLCSLLPYYNKEDTPCRQNLQLAVSIAATLGEPYYFRCPSGFIKIAVPLFEKGVYSGCIIAGPMLMANKEERGQDDGAALARVLSLNADAQLASEARLARVLSLFKAMPCFSAKKVTALATLLFRCVNNEGEQPGKLAGPENDAALFTPALPLHSHAVLCQEYPAAEERNLLHQIACGNLLKAQTTMTSYLNQILILEKGDLDGTKNHLTQLCVLVSRNAGEEPAIAESFSFIHTLHGIESINGLKDWAENLIRYFVSKNLSALYSGGSGTVTDAVRLVLSDEYFSLTFSDITDQLHVNKCWFSTHFKKEMGISFTQFVTGQKIKKAQQLLHSTDLRLIEISSRCGFEEQSYFTKLFKQETGMTPKEYRLRRP